MKLSDAERVRELDIERHDLLLAKIKTLQWLLAHPEVPLPTGVRYFSTTVYVDSEVPDQKARLAELARKLAPCEKVVVEGGPESPGYLGVERVFTHGQQSQKLQVLANREATCTARVVGQKTVKVPVSAPLPPLRYEERVVNEVEWDCPPLLAP